MVATLEDEPVITENSVSSEEITIDAPAELVWSVLVDFDNYHLWNDFCPQIEAELKLGAPVAMQVDLGDGLQPQTEYITRLEAPGVITWTMENKPGDPVHADRSQYVKPIDDSSWIRWICRIPAWARLSTFSKASGTRSASGIPVSAMLLPRSSPWPQAAALV